MPRPARHLALSLLLFALTAQAQEWAGTVKSASGETYAERNGQRIAIKAGDRVFPGDKLISGKDSQIGVTLRDDTLISASANSQLSIREFSFNPATHEGGMAISILRGVTAMVSGPVAKANPQAMRVNTPTTTIGIRGTEFVVEVEADE